MYRIASLGSIVLMLTISFAALADETRDLLEMDLEELLKLTVVSAAKQEQTLEDAPAIIDVVTAWEIEASQCHDLYELLSYLPGIEVMETYWGRTVLQFRGVMNVHYNNKVLLLVNGVPMYEPIFGSYFLEQIPMKSIRQIEVIRGPGSSLFGTNAYSGVINIITKMADCEGDRFAASAGYGRFSTVHANAEMNWTLGSQGGLFLATEIVNGDGYDYEVVVDEMGNSGVIDYYNNTASLFGNLAYGQISADFGYFNQRKMDFGIVPNLLFSGEGRQTQSWFTCRYLFDGGDRFNLKATGSVRFTDIPEIDIGAFPYPGFAGHDSSGVYINASGQVYHGELQATSTWSDEFSTVFGVALTATRSSEFIWRWRDDETRHPHSAWMGDQSGNSVAFYSQCQFEADRYQLVGGVRVVKSDDIADPLVAPRAGLIYKLNPINSVKFLFGNAYRNPSFMEKHVATYDVLYGSEDLKPEEIRTLDLSLESHGQRGDGRLNVFIEDMCEGIIRVPTNDPETQGGAATIYANASRQRLTGVELAFRLSLSQNAYIGHNASWKQGEDRDSGDDLLYFAELTTSGWLQYVVGNNLYIGPNYHYVGKRKGVSSNGEYVIDGYLLLNLNLRYALSDDWTLMANVKNMLDLDYSYPEYVRHRIEKVPGGPGRTIGFILSYQP